MARFYCSSGSPDRVVYKSYFNDFGRLCVREDGREDWQGYINSFKDSCDINIIIKRCTMGDDSLLHARPSGFFGDFTQFPKTYAGMLNLMAKASDTFDSLPVDIKHKFGDNVNEFIASAGSLDWASKLGYTPEVKEVSADES